MKVLLVISLLLQVLFVYSQENKQMLMLQIEGNSYIKKSYDKNGALLDYTVFKVGALHKGKTQYTLPLKIYGYDKNGSLKDSSITKYTCKPSEETVLMNILPYAQYSSNKTVTIELENGAELYPSTWVKGTKMADITMSLSLDGGALGAIGSGGEVKMTERKVTEYDPALNTYTLSSKVEIKVYMFGFKVNTIEYDVKETVHPQKGIVEQYFKKSTG